MFTVSDLWRKWFPTAQPAPNSAAAAVVNARALLGYAAAAGRPIPSTVVQPILNMKAALDAGPVPAATEQAFYAAFTDLTQATADISKRVRERREYPFEDAVEDAEQLLKHAAETGTDVLPAVAADILAARSALKANTLTDGVRAKFYAAYAGLSKLFGDVTAETIRNCGSSQTWSALRRDRRWAVSVTVLVAVVSVITFVADTTVKKIGEDISSANDLAAKLGVGLTPGEASPAVPAILASDPCSQVEKPQDPVNTPKVRTLADVSQLQEFGGTTRALQSRSIKLNNMMRDLTFSRVEECNIFALTCSAEKNAKEAMRPDLAKRLQINAAIPNYPAAVLCMITTYQDVRSFATNVRDNYTSIIGAITSYALPIVYALLGAYAYRLRLFADTIRKRTYHPSFSDSARMITAVIAGAICGLFNPAQGLTFSPLAVAFLVGYGVELFFKLLDTLITSFDRGSKEAKPAN
jgi:hypothetical protein